MLPRIELTAAEVEHVRNGRAIRSRADAANADELAGVDSAGRLVALLVPRGPDLLGPTRNMPV